MKTSTIIIGAAALAVVGYVAYRRLAAPATSTTSTQPCAIKTALADAWSKVRGATVAAPATDDGATARASAGGLDITSTPHDEIA